MSLACDINHIYNPLHSGLGNVLFLIASTYGIANANKLSVTIPSLNTFFNNWGTKYKTGIFRKINTNDTGNKMIKIYELKKRRFTYWPTSCKNMNELVGYYQSYKYFDKIQPTIKNLFQIDDNTKEYIIKKYGEIYAHNTTISIHIRRTDYCTMGFVLDFIYYTKAVAHFIKLSIDNIKFMIFSDDIEWCKTKFVGNHFYFVENEDDYVDLYIMSFCNHNIIANSTFSWWGAYLNNYNDKIVIYPKKWFINDVRYTKIKADFFPGTWVEI